MDTKCGQLNGSLLGKQLWRPCGSIEHVGTLSSRNRLPYSTSWRTWPHWANKFLQPEVFSLNTICRLKRKLIKCHFIYKQLKILSLWPSGKMLWHIYSVKLCRAEMTPSTAPSYSAKRKYLFSLLKGILSCSSLFAVFPQVVWTNGSWALNCWLCSEPWCSLIVRHKESSLRRCISGPWLYGCLFCLFKRRSKSDKKLIFSLACTYPLYYVNIDSKRNSCSCNNPSDLMLPWYILTLGDCLLKTTSYKSCCFPEMFLYSSNAICCTSSP